MNRIIRVGERYLYCFTILSSCTSCTSCESLCLITTVSSSPYPLSITPPDDGEACSGSPSTTSWSNITVKFRISRGSSALHDAGFQAMPLPPAKRLRCGVSPQPLWLRKHPDEVIATVPHGHEAHRVASPVRPKEGHRQPDSGQAAACGTKPGGIPRSRAPVRTVLRGSHHESPGRSCGWRPGSHAHQAPSPACVDHQTNVHIVE